MTPAERQVFRDAQVALLEAMTAAAKAAVAISALTVADGVPVERTEDRIGRALMFNTRVPTEPVADDRPKPGPPKERS